MKRILLFLLVPVLLFSCDRGGEPVTGTEAEPEAVTVTIPENILEDVNEFVDHMANLEKPEALDDKFSYAYGNLFASSLFHDSNDIDVFYFMRGILDYYGTSFFTDEEFQDIFTEYQKALLGEAQKRYEKESKANLKAANDFLEVNARRSGVKVLPSGLQYEVLREGDGKDFPDMNDLVRIHYTITLLNGVVADSSYDRGEPFTFEVSKMLAGASEGLRLMSTGGKCRFWIPPSLAYGENGPSVIGPNELIIFDVELFEIEKK